MTSKKAEVVSVQVSAQSYKAITEAVDRLGSKKQVVMNRLMEWFAEADENIQIAVYNYAHAQTRPPLADMLRRMADSLDPPPPTDADQFERTGEPKPPNPAPPRRRGQPAAPPSVASR